MGIEVRDPRMGSIVDPEARLEKLGSGFDFTEGPVWHPRERHLIFSDMPGDHMRKWTADGRITTFRKPSNKANGNAYDAKGRLITCEHATSRVTRTEPSGALTVLASHWDGKQLNSPNDVVVKSDGAIYFSDPTYGRVEYYGVPRDPELGFRGVYRIATDRSLSLLADGFGQPNGLCFSPDEKRLFVNDTDRGHIRVFDVGANGGLSSSRVWATPSGEGDGGVDGMKIDRDGNLYCTGPGGVHVFAPDGTCLGVIRLPEVAANFAWGDDDLCSLFFAASTSLYRMPVKIPGKKPF